MTGRSNPDNGTTVPVLDKRGNPLMPSRPSRVRRWLETGRASRVWIKGIFAVQLQDVDAAESETQPLGLNLDPGRTTGVAITRESQDGWSEKSSGPTSTGTGTKR